MATATTPPPAPADPFDTTIWAIVSADRGVNNSTTDALAFQAAGLPPSGAVTLETLSSAATNGNAAGAPSAAYNALYTPSQLWVTVPVAAGGPYQIIAYTSYGTGATQSGLTATAQQAAIDVAPIDSATNGQLWSLTAQTETIDVAGKPVAPQAYLIENTQIVGAIKRASSYPVPGVGIDLGMAPDLDMHKVPFSYEMVQVPQPAAATSGSAPPSDKSK